MYYNGDKSFTLQWMNDKLFETPINSEKVFKLRKAVETDAHRILWKIENDKQKKMLYEVFWQTGDMDDTWFDTVSGDTIKAEELLKGSIIHLENCHIYVL